MSTHNWPIRGGAGGSLYWQDAVSTAASLPVSGNIAGAVRQTLDTEDFYRWDGAAWLLYLNPSGDVEGPASAVDGEVAVFNGVTGKLIKSATGSGPARLASGVLGTGVTALGSEVSGVLPVANGGTNSSTALVNNRVVQTTGGKLVEAAAITAARTLISDANGIPTHSAVTATELGYISGVTGAVQPAVDSKLPLAGGTMTGDIILVGDASAPLNPISKQQFDAAVWGLDSKPSVLVATTANIALTGAQTIDGVALLSGNRVLVKNQSTPAQNGIYVAAAGAWSRATDFDSWPEAPGALVVVEAGGTVNQNTAWICTSATGGTLGTTPITFSQVAGAGTFTTDGQGIELTGVQFFLELDGLTLSKSATGVKVADLGIANAQVATAAAITRTKLATGTANRMVVNDGSGVISEAAAITAARALISDANGIPTHATVTSTELGYLSGVTSAVQGQIDARLCTTSVTTISGNVTLANKVINLVDTTSARSLTLPAASTGVYVVVKDKSGNAGTNIITLTPPSGTIDGGATYLVDANYASVAVVSDGTNFFVI